MFFKKQNKKKTKKKNAEFHILNFEGVEYIRVFRGTKNKECMFCKHLCTTSTVTSFANGRQFFFVNNSDSD